MRNLLRWGLFFLGALLLLVLLFNFLLVPGAPPGALAPGRCSYWFFGWRGVGTGAFFLGVLLLGFLLGLGLGLYLKRDAPRRA
ncbi:hypothetical protein GCM10007092_06920 [Thermus composti]|nr:hypothetical protein GCM10007092_06920 [Thermus composti]